MGVIIVVIDRLIWWPLIVWSRKFKLDDFGGNRAPRTSLQLWMAGSAAIQFITGSMQKLKARLLPPPQPPSAETSLIPIGAKPPPPRRIGAILYAVMVAALLSLFAWGGFRLAWLVGQVHLADWLEMLKDASLSFVRVLAAVLIGTVWTVPFGNSIA